ncbi:MAG TPA: hypothetical protein VHC69_27480 [Polyangiaceae bacterium]|nr:hypothetical protein [Polyangiaceae bacterium]
MTFGAALDRHAVQKKLRATIRAVAFGHGTGRLDERESKAQKDGAQRRRVLAFPMRRKDDATSFSLASP